MMLNGSSAYGKILPLTLSKKWFDLILSGKKKVEYREFKDHWKARFLDKHTGHPRQDYSHILFTNGYTGTSRKMIVELRAIQLYHKSWLQPEHGEELTTEKYFILHLGEVFDKNLVDIFGKSVTI
jgi:hypothetical protein